MLRPLAPSPVGEAGRGSDEWGVTAVPWHLLACAVPVRDWRRAKDDADATDWNEGDSVLPADPGAPSTRSLIVGLVSRCHQNSSRLLHGRRAPHALNGACGGRATRDGPVRPWSGLSSLPANLLQDGVERASVSQGAGTLMSPEPIVKLPACGLLARDGSQLSRLPPDVDRDVSCRSWCGGPDSRRARRVYSSARICAG